MPPIFSKFPKDFLPPTRKNCDLVYNGSLASGTEPVSERGAVCCGPLELDYEEIEMRRLFTLAICGIGLLALGSVAQAAPILGEVHFVGLWAPSGGSGTATATGIDFVNFQIVLAGTDDYAGLTGTGVAFQNFAFAPFGSPVVPLWAFSSGGRDYSFDLTSVAVTSQTSTQLGLVGTGVLHITGSDDTPATWDFTGNQGSKLFSFSADNVAVPEPTTVGMLGLGLIGLTAAGSKRSSNVA